VRTDDHRRSESAREYLDFSAVTPALEATVEVTAKLMNFPIALVNIIDEDDQFTLVSYRADGLQGSVVPRSRSVCSVAIETGLPLVVADPRSSDPAIVEMAARMDAASYGAYVSVPLTGRESLPIGTLCVLDTVPREAAADDYELLRQLAVVVEEQLDAQRRRDRMPVEAASVGELKAALECGAIVPWYEPIVDLASGRVVGMEALARWHHPERGVLRPGDFIAQIEDSHLIVDLDLAILENSVADFASWLHLDPDLRLSVNVSGVHFGHEDSVGRIAAVAEAAGVDPRRVILEITETAMATTNSKVEAKFVAELREHGFVVVLDDLGGGWAPMDRLLSVRVDGFKIDRSITLAFGTTVGEALVRAMAGFAADLSMMLVIEGIESSEQAAVAARWGCTWGQGHYWSPAVPAIAVPAMVAALDRLVVS
jgi:EAL domain-containing protein (putative c-di-GMP-specific phosphodiesterase class I)